MLERIDAMENELSALIESLRTGSNRLNADLQLLEGNLTAVKNAVVPRPAFEPEHPAPQPQRVVRPEEPPATAPPTFEGAVQVTGAAAGEVLAEPSVRARAGGRRRGRTAPTTTVRG